MYCTGAQTMEAKDETEIAAHNFRSYSFMRLEKPVVKAPPAVVADATSAETMQNERSANDTQRILLSFSKRNEGPLSSHQGHSPTAETEAVLPSDLVTTTGTTSTTPSKQNKHIQDKTTVIIDKVVKNQTRNNQRNTLQQLHRTSCRKH